MVAQIDMTPALGRTCDKNSDYETWIPVDPSNNMPCVIGRRRIYERRKQDSICLNGYDHDHLIVDTTCPCSREDYECDFGFFQPNINSVCVPEDGYIEAVPYPCFEGETYLKTKGYRRVAGDTCSGGDEALYEPVAEPCPVVPLQGLTMNSTATSFVSIAKTIYFNTYIASGSTEKAVFFWDFGDGSNFVKTSETSISHAFIKGGKFIVTVTVRNGASETTSSVTVEVRGMDSIFFIYFYFIFMLFFFYVYVFIFLIIFLFF